MLYVYPSSSINRHKISTPTAFLCCIRKTRAMYVDFYLASIEFSFFHKCTLSFTSLINEQIRTMPNKIYSSEAFTQPYAKLVAFTNVSDKFANALNNSRCMWARRLSHFSNSCRLVWCRCLDIDGWFFMAKNFQMNDYVNYMSKSKPISDCIQFHHFGSLSLSIGLRSGG